MSPFSSPASFLGGKDVNPKGLLIISSILGNLGFLCRYFHVAGQWRTEFREVITCFSVSFLSTLKSAFTFVCLLLFFKINPKSGQPGEFLLCSGTDVAELSLHSGLCLAQNRANVWKSQRGARGAGIHLSSCISHQATTLSGCKTNKRKLAPRISSTMKVWFNVSKPKDSR